MMRRPRPVGADRPRCGRIRGNQHLAFPKDTPHANLLVTLMQRMGVPLGEALADSTGAFAEV